MTITSTVAAIIETAITNAPTLAKRSKFSNMHSFVEKGRVIYRFHRTLAIPALLGELTPNQVISDAIAQITLEPFEALSYDTATQWFEYSVKALARG